MFCQKWEQKKVDNLDEEEVGIVTEIVEVIK